MAVSGDDIVSVDAEVTVSSLRWTSTRFLFVGAVTAMADKTLNKKSVSRAARDARLTTTKLKHTVKNTMRVDQSSPAPVPRHPSHTD